LIRLFASRVVGSTPTRFRQIEKIKFFVPESRDTGKIPEREVRALAPLIDFV
jgi:hypothetical protein